MHMIPIGNSNYKVKEDGKENEKCDVCKKQFKVDEVVSFIKIVDMKCPSGLDSYKAIHLSCNGV